MSDRWITYKGMDGYVSILVGPGLLIGIDKEVNYEIPQSSVHRWEFRINHRLVVHGLSEDLAHSLAASIREYDWEDFGNCLDVNELLAELVQEGEIHA